jgi:hypothetical protein
VGFRVLRAKFQAYEKGGLPETSGKTALSLEEPTYLSLINAR